jgi:hypothetical protein
MAIDDDADAPSSPLVPEPKSVVTRQVGRRKQLPSAAVLEKVVRSLARQSYRREQ